MPVVVSSSWAGGCAAPCAGGECVGVECAAGGCAGAAGDVFAWANARLLRDYDAMVAIPAIAMRRADSCCRYRFRQ